MAGTTDKPIIIKGRFELFAVGDKVETQIDLYAPSADVVKVLNSLMDMISRGVASGGVQVQTRKG